MAISRIIGGLGNQMFQYAICRHLSIINNDELYIDIRGFQRYKLHNYCLSNFNIKEKLYDTIQQCKYIVEKSINCYTYDDTILKNKGNIYLKGYWQSEKYFKDIENIIREEFQPKKPLNNDLLKKIQNTNSVFLHVRRGDFYTINEKAHGLNLGDYYINAIKHMLQNIENPVFYIFSDDILWCKQNIKTQNSIFIEGNTNYHDLQLMYSCKHGITANSTFSWWGAWLNQNDNKIIICPKKWTNVYNDVDLIPESWIRI